MPRLLLLVLLLSLTYGCARRSAASGPAVSPDAPVAVGSSPTSLVTAEFAEGQASWYGDPYHGRRSASGETFDKNKLTAAHRTLPFDTWVRVENQLNNRSVDVRINDRGPFVRGRIIDLSQRAAEALDMVRAGVVPVRLSVIREPDQVSAPVAVPVRREEDVFYVVQLGAFRSEERAQNLVVQLESRYTGIYVEPPSGEGGLYRVRIGRAILSDARYVQNLLETEDSIEAIVQEVRSED